ncbi:GtrA family protein [Ferrovum sp.]|uniref:GtrA family protein n=1 Tax=Ferrovum sp. TaxID=2609467 RepID=UPI0026212E6A|nr:GtrA family protein [Ferrovum sp.]
MSPTTEKFKRILLFAAAGTVGFGVDVLTVLATHACCGLVGAQALGFLLAVTATWGLNRRYAFAGRGSERWLREWARYLMANGWGALLNNGTYLLAIWVSPWLARHPAGAVALGSLAGMGANYLAAQRWVFIHAQTTKKH